MAGKFITIEGQDGAGKSTNIEVISSRLAHSGIKYQVTREPGGTNLGEALRALLLQDKDNLIGDMAELLLMFAARAQHLKEVIEPVLESGEWVVCDRFTDASYAYQGGGRNMDSSAIATLETLVQGQLRPDLTVLLDLPVEISAERADARSAPDRFEVQAQQFKQRVRTTYLELAKNDPNRVQVVDASQTLVQVNQAVSDLIDSFIARENG